MNPKVPLRYQKLMEKLGIDMPKHSAAQLKAAEEAAKKVGLTADVYHGSPALFDTIKPGKDNLIHVAPTLESPVERLRHLMGEDSGVDSAFMYPLKTRIENPLTVTDSGDFSFDALLRDEQIKKLLNKREEGKLQGLEQLYRDTKGDRALDSMRSGGPYDKKMEALDKELKNISGEGTDRIQEALKKRGYDSLHYKNQAEVDLAKMELLADAFEKEEEIRMMERQMKKSPPELRDLMAKEIEVKKESLDRINKHIPDSYALFKDTPLRSLDAKFDPKKIKSHPNKLLYGGAGVASAPFLLGDEAKAASEDIENYERPSQLKGILEGASKAAHVVDKVTGEPLRKSVYKALGGEDKEEVEGSDIISAMENKIGAPVPEMPGATIKMKDMLGIAADVGLDASNVIPGVMPVKGSTKFNKILKSMGEVGSIGKDIRDVEKLSKLDFPKGKWEKDIYNERGFVKPLDVNFLKQMQGNELGKTDINKLKDSISKEGLNEPVILTFDPKTKRAILGEGNHRVEALNQLGYSKVPTRMYRGTVDESEGTAIPFKMPADATQKVYYPADANPEDIIDFDKILKGLK